ncbi:TPA: argininosuccinate lyase [bacterium]|nr:argininosuccinate lyase [bacterium]
MKLWQKDYEIDKRIDGFVVGDDWLFDQRLVRFDAIGTIGHIKSLNKLGIITDDEEKKIKNCLLEIIELDKKKEFVISPSDEDCHTKIENYLIEKLGDVGKKVHTGRSRNDQVILAIRLYSKSTLIEIRKKTISLIEAFLNLAKEGENIPMPGRTHLQKAMPSSVGLWAGAFSESIIDGLSIIESAYRMNDQSPLGAGSSYGVPIDIDRDFIREIFGFSRIQKNSLYVINSRGKQEAYILFSLLWIILDLSKFAEDLIIFSLPEFGYFFFPDSFLLGSSMMPQKKNPSFLEIIRARSNTFISYISRIFSIINSLPSGYNQDLQETKKTFFLGLDLAEKIIDTSILIVQNLRINEDNLTKGFTRDIFATDHAIDLVLNEGIPFRDAYRKVAEEIENLPSPDPYVSLKKRKHIGGPGNLMLDELKEEINRAKERIRKDEEGFINKINGLLSTE